MNKEKLSAEETTIDFGDYVEIEQHRYGACNEMFVCKVIGRLKSNTWVEVPEKGIGEEVMHPGQMEHVVRAVHCGVDETIVKKYRVKDVRYLKSTSKGTEQLQREREEAENVILDYVEAFTSGDSTARMNAIQKAIDFLTPKTEK